MSAPFHRPGLALLRADNLRMTGKLAVIALLMFGFGYALVPMYKAICNALGINVLSVSEQRTGYASGTRERPANTQVDLLAHRDDRVRRQCARARGISSRRSARCRCIRARSPP